MDDIDHMIAKLEGSKTLVKMAVTRGVHRAGLMVEGDAKRLCPVKSGRLRSSINTKTQETAEGAEATVGTNAEYAPYVEYGTGKRGDSSVPHRVDWLGSQPHPFLRPALKFNTDSGNIEKVIQYEVEKVFK